MYVARTRDADAVSTARRRSGARDVLRDGREGSRTSKKKKEGGEARGGSRLRLYPPRARRAPLARRGRRVHRERVRGHGVADEARQHAARRARHLGLNPATEAATVSTNNK